MTKQNSELEQTVKEIDSANSRASNTRSAIYGGLGGASLGALGTLAMYGGFCLASLDGSINPNSPLPIDHASYLYAGMAVSVFFGGIGALMGYDVAKR